MAVASEAPASFRSSAVRPHPLALVRNGLDELVSRRRLIRYLVQADLKKKGADTLLGGPGKDQLVGGPGKDHQKQ
jgi:hypothetical protein